LSPEETFNYVTGLAFEKRGEEFLNEVQAYEKNIRLQSEAVKEKEDFSFDYFFNQPRELTADDSSSDDDDDENYVDLTSGDEDITKKSDKPSSRKKKLSKSSP
jgi:hypothetical protein